MRAGAWERVRMGLFVVIFGFSAQLATADSRCSTDPCPANQYHAGFAKVDISPVIGKDVVPVLEGEPQLVTKIHDPLFAKALIITDGSTSVAVVALDLIGLSPAAFAKLQQYLVDNSQHDHLVLSLTHTHSGFIDEQTLPLLKANALAAITLANSNLEPVQIGAASARVDEAYNRRVYAERGVEMLWQNPDRKPNRPVDNELGVIHIQRLDGSPLVNIVNYSAHPTITMDLHTVVVSADYPSVITTRLSQSVGGEVMFLLGAAGDVNPFDSGTQPTALAVEKMHQLGTKLADAAARSVANISVFTQSGNIGIDTHSVNNPAAELSAIYLPPNILLATFPGEYFNELGLQLKTQSPVQHTFFIGYTNGTIGYVPTTEDFARGGYGADSTSMHPSTTALTGQQHIKASLELIMKLVERDSTQQR